MFYFTSPLDQFNLNELYNSYFLISTFNLYCFLVLILFFIFILFNNNSDKILPNKYKIIIEAFNDTIYSLVKNQIPGSGIYYFPFIFTIFIFIIIANLLSLLPYSFALTSQMIFIISLSFIIWISVTLIGLYNLNWEFFNAFLPLGTPLSLSPLLILIEFISYSVRSISLGLRLIANTVSGHLLLIILAFLLLKLMSLSFSISLVPFTGIVAILILEFAIALIQSYVFCILSSGYLKDALYSH